jgi:UDP-N-acetylglucosamine--N-acetylmuramyl-(pentapeptide) pyrophosphoryl-undecaprenol N-acetylglucosamine transferase
MRVVLTGGGTGGHIYPLLAVAEAARDWQTSFIGSTAGLESQIVPRGGLDFYAVASGGVRGKSLPVRLRSLARSTIGVLAAYGILARLRPTVVVSSGGYAALPVTLAARLRGIPLALIEPNATPGLANRVAMRYAARILIAYDAARDQLPREVRSRAVVTGVPVRARRQVSRREARETLGIDERVVLTAVTGGSQGARALNAAVCGMAEMLGEDDRVLLATGQREHEQWAEAATDRLSIAPYFWDMDIVLAAADVFVGRAGAMTCAEILCAGLPSVLVPLPNPAVHQDDNAQVLANAGAAVVLDEQRLDPHLLWQALEPILRDVDLRRSMRTAALSLARPDAAKTVAHEVSRLGGRLG